MRDSVAVHGPHRYLVLDSLRGICACMVVLLHFPGTGWISTMALVRHAYLFVDFFFVLSGFVIASAYRRRLAGGYPIGSFMLLRLARIYPLHIVVLVMFVTARLIFDRGEGAFFVGIHGLHALIASIGLVHIFGGPDKAVWNIPSWSIAAEFWTYLIFGLVFTFAATRAMLIALALAVTMPIWLFLRSSTGIEVVHDGAILRCLYGFALGVLGQAAIVRLPRAHVSRRRMAHLAEVAMAGLVVCFVQFFAEGRISLFGPPIFLGVILVFAREAGVLSALLARRPVRLLGLLSFSIYMLHHFVQLRLIGLLTAGDRLTGRRWGLVSHGRDGARIAGPEGFADLVCLLMLLGVIVLAWLSYRFVEVPGMQLGRRLLDCLSRRERAAVTLR